ncbi:fibrinogen alpha chain [Synchiropus splendidus]|uniref:fibrinogen alpha chain n=1 Tax=Synchiropus splendidus TaxID=270530 RepID=UPI00237DA61E|nr:fibrinogen alpha chain [Synchiropus splendidus]
MKSCPRKSNFGLCTDDDWTSKCPSGCRLQGLISNMEEKSETKLRKACQTGQVLEEALERLESVIHLMYDKARRALDSRRESELKFSELSGELSQNLTVLRQKSARLEHHLETLRGRAREQIEELYRIEVDVDMKLRACGGSCQSPGSFRVDHASFQSLAQPLDTAVSDTGAAYKGVPHLKLQPTVTAEPGSAEHEVMLPFQRLKVFSHFKIIVPNRLVLSESGQVEQINNEESE